MAEEENKNQAENAAPKAVDSTQETGQVVAAGEADFAKKAVAPAAATATTQGAAVTGTAAPATAAPATATPAQAAAGGLTISVTTTQNQGGLALVLTLFFGPVGAFFSLGGCWAKKSFIYSFLFALLYSVLLIICGVLCLFLIGYILLTIVYIIELVHCYKSCSHPQPVVQTIRINNNQ